MKKGISNNHIDLEELLNDKSNYSSFTVDKKTKEKLAHIPFDHTTATVSKKKFPLVKRIKRKFDTSIPSLHSRLLTSRYSFSTLLLVIVIISGVFVFYKQGDSLPNNQIAVYDLGENTQGILNDSEPLMQEAPMMTSMMPEQNSRMDTYQNEDGAFEDRVGKRQIIENNREQNMKSSGFGNTNIEDGAIQSSTYSIANNEDTAVKHSLQRINPLTNDNRRMEQSPPNIIPLSEKLGEILLEILYSVIILVP